MKYPVLLLPIASDDLLECIAWYDDQKDGLGNQFYAAVVEVVDIIASNRCSQNSIPMLQTRTVEPGTLALLKSMMSKAMKTQ